MRITYYYDTNNMQQHEHNRGGHIVENYPFRILVLVLQCNTTQVASRESCCEK